MDRKAFINTIVEVLKYDKKYRAIEVRDQLMIKNRENRKVEVEEQK